MSWPFGSSDRAADVAAQLLIHDRLNGRLGAKGTSITRARAQRHSAVWACLSLRADLISTMPIDVFRRVAGVQVEVPKPPVLVAPGGSKVLIDEWMYNTQIDLDSVGNAVGIITAVDGLGLPARIELVNIDDVTIENRQGWTEPRVRIGGDTWSYSQVWHERQYTRSGLMVGLSPIAHAAMTVNAHLSAQEFARDWFDNSATPSAHFKNEAKTLKPGEAAKIKTRFAESMQAGEPLVTGKDWSYNMLGAKASESGWLDITSAGVLDVCRFLRVPGDMIDAPVGGSSVTYANITQRNMQLLITNIGPAVERRERALSTRLLANPRYVKLNTAALLRMDYKSQLEGHKVAIDSRIYPPSRALDMLNMPPLTPEELAEFAMLFPNKAVEPARQ